jgi:hypothetical protein
MSEPTSKTHSSLPQSESRILMPLIHSDTTEKLSRGKILNDLLIVNAIRADRCGLNESCD